MRAMTLTATCGLTAALMIPMLAGGAGAADVPLVLTSARVTVEGTSNVHEWTASTTAVLITEVDIAAGEGDLLQAALQPGALRAFDLTIPARGLTSPKEGIDKNMHKALKVEEHPHITFRLRAFEPAGANYQATGMLTIAGVEREVVLNLEVQPKAGAIVVTGTTGLVMTDYGIKPPSAMLGMVKAGPKVTIRLELTMAAS